MRDAGDAFPLPARHRGKQRARSDKQHPIDLPPFQFVVDIRIEHHRAAPRAASALKFVLDHLIDDFPAIDVVGLNIDALFPGQILDDTAAQRPEVSRHDQVIVIGSAPRILQVGQNGIARRGRHGRAHIVDGRDAKIHHLPERSARNRGMAPCTNVFRLC